MILRRFTSPELIQYGMRSEIWLQTARVYWLGEGTISVSCSMCVRLLFLGRHKHTQQKL